LKHRSLRCALSFLLKYRNWKKSSRRRNPKNPRWQKAEVKWATGAAQSKQKPLINMAAKSVKSKAQKKTAKEERWELRLYVAAQTPKSLVAFANLKKYCEEHLK